MRDQTAVEKAYESAKVIYKDWGIDVDSAMQTCAQVPVSMHCWQGDDVIGFDAEALTGGIAATGHYPGRANSPEELRQDITQVLSMVPGKKKLNMHASYAEKNGAKIDRDAYRIEQFQNWIDFAKEHKLGMDFNPTFFSHPMMDGDFSLSSNKESVRKFWIEHGKRSREIGKGMAEQLGQPCIINFWMPDGYKDLPADTRAPRERMLASLDEIFSEKIDVNLVKDTIESKLFGLGIEAHTVASHEFSYGYAISRGKMYTLDAGHFHPTEVISAKLSAVMCYLDEVLLHVSRPVRWDSDHVIVLDDELTAIMKEVVRGGYLKRVHLGLDYFDASINRVSAWTIGMRNAQRALLIALLEPSKMLQEFENQDDYTHRLAWMEESKTLPFASVWDYYCLKQGVPVGVDWIGESDLYEKNVLSKR